MARKKATKARSQSSARRAAIKSRAKSVKIVKKGLSKGFWAGAWAGTCFGLASTILVMEFATGMFPKPLAIGLLAALLDAILLIVGVIGFTLFRKFAKS